ncbi:PBP1A family penicillin-binding protein [Candidatus Woesebacteria bacterium]|jgi:1A family penicillin-binding protein|nr:PBP1A family penicillin-binding protein [Candidatus Woesebacteria bacterium]MBP9687415.1 PBP1A family penicillin-binding protein [Candidatus Woesebacteria bacterium]
MATKTKTKAKNKRQTVVKVKQVKKIVTPAPIQIQTKKLRRRLFEQLTIRKRLTVVVGLLVLLLVGVIYILWNIPLPDKLSDDPAVSTKIFDRNQKLIYEIYAKERRTPVTLEEIPKTLQQATIAIEDKDFYKHGGFSITGIARAFYKTIFQQNVQGGSTLTQQLVKSSLLTPERTIRRKIREFILATLVELRYSKDQILTMYLNQIPYGSTAYGVESAATLYFGKSAKDLDLAESALLAGITPAPSKYSPFGANPEFAKERQKSVLRRMVEDGYISQEESDAAYEEKLVYATPEKIKAPHFALKVKELLSDKYGESVVEQGGLRVTTTLDLDLQEFAQDAVATEVAKLTKLDVGNGAAVVTYPKTGEILAMIGSKDYNAKDEDGKVNIMYAKRQPGSSIKPLNYALAIRDHKITASTPLADIPTCFQVIGQAQYCPVNYDGQFHGAVQTRFSLGNSYNIPAVRVLALNGIENFITFATELGITSFTDPANYGLSLTLGGGEIKPVDMAVAYGVFANGGIKQDLKMITKVTDWKGKVLEETTPEALNGPRVLDEETAFIVSHMLQDNNARTAAFGPSSFLNVSGHPEVSVKTGTTNDRRDNWTVGYTPQAVVLTWVGNNDNSVMKGAVSGVSGASPIWNKIMKETLNKAGKGFYAKTDKGQAWPIQPAGVVGATICANTGAISNDASNGCPERFEYFIKDTVPTDVASRQDIVFDRVAQKQADQASLPENVESQNHLVITDPLASIVCLDCAFPMSQVTINYPPTAFFRSPTPTAKPKPITP